jgi:hypothetical protein
MSAVSYDLHQHLWPEEVVEALTARTAPPRLDGSTLELGEGAFELDLDAHVLERRLAQLDGDGIDVALVSLQPTLADPLPPDLVDAYHEGIVRVAADSDGRVRPLGAAAVVEGCAGACVAAAALADLDRLAPLLDELELRRQPLFVHPGPPGDAAAGPSWWAPGIDYPAQMQSAFGRWMAEGAERWPSLHVVFAILAGGAPFQLERLAAKGFDSRAALNANVYFDTASYGRRAVEFCLATYGVGHVVYGSDAPVMDPSVTLGEVQSFGDAVVAAVCQDNPARLLA